MYFNIFLWFDSPNSGLSPLIGREDVVLFSVVEPTPELFEGFLKSVFNLYLVYNFESLPKKSF